MKVQNLLLCHQGCRGEFPVGSRARLSRKWCRALTPVLGSFRLCVMSSIEEIKS